MKEVRCVPLSTVALRNLKQLGQVKLYLLDSSNKMALSEAIGEACDILFVEVTGDDVSWLPLSDKAERMVLIGSTTARLTFHVQIDRPTWQQKITHCKLGGLTKAATVVSWGGGWRMWRHVEITRCAFVGLALQSLTSTDTNGATFGIPVRDSKDDQSDLEQIGSD
jgi:hypothetical protein